jgi:hypothetical protein
VDNANVFDFVLEKENIDRLTALDEFLITVSSLVPLVPTVRSSNLTFSAGLGGDHHPLGRAQQYTFLLNSDYRDRVQGIRTSATYSPSCS